LSSELDVLREYIHKNGLRFTPEREAIVKEVFSRHDHFTVDELYLSLRRKRPISRASLYRAIPLLIEAGLISEVFQDSGQTRYEHTYGHEHHCHLRCRICGEVIEFHEPFLEDLENRVAADHGYQSSGHRLEVLGCCPACQKKDRSRGS
jgi:Fur family ferric uptake transcriptional regulator